MAVGEWKKYKVSDIGRVVTGKTPKTAIKENYGGDCPFLTPTDDMSVKYVRKTIKTLSDLGKDASKSILIPKDSVCVSCIGSDLGKVVITTEDTVTNQQINSVVVDKNLYDVSFIYYAMTELGKVLNFQSKTSTAIPIINKTMFSNCEIICPPLETQQKIASILSVLDDKIELNNEINKNLEEQAQSLYSSTFGNKSPNGKLSDILHEMPKSKIKVGDAKGVKGLYPFFTSGQAILEWNEYLVDGRYIYMNTGGNAGVNFYIGKASYSTDTWCISTKNKMTDMLYLMLSGMLEELNFTYFEGSALKHLQKQKLKEKELYIPTEEELTEFNNLIMPIFDKISENKSENKMLIARVNRVYGDKEGGLVVDYVGIANALKQAMSDYTVRDRENYGNTDIASMAYPKFLEKLDICQSLIHGFDYSKFLTGSDLERSQIITGAVNFLIAPQMQDRKETFQKEALALHQALSLCSSIVEKDERVEAAFFESLRVLIGRLTNTGVGKKISLPEMNARINELLKQSIKSDGVLNLFSDIKEEFSLFDTGFLNDIAKMKEKNLAVEILKKLLSEQLSVYKRTNVVKSEKFSDLMQKALNKYINGLITNQEVIEELLKMAKAISEEDTVEGLTNEEIAFYDALTKPQAIKDFYENDELIAMTKELTETLRKNKTIDWQNKQFARAKMMMMIKRLLKKYNYPPEGEEDAIQTVMTQCELWTDNVMEG